MTSDNNPQMPANWKWKLLLAAPLLFAMGLLFTIITYGQGDLGRNDWQSMVAGPAMICLSPILFWIAYRN